MCPDLVEPPATGDEAWDPELDFPPTSAPPVPPGRSGRFTAGDLRKILGEFAVQQGELQGFCQERLTRLMDDQVHNLGQLLLTWCEASASGADEHHQRGVMDYKYSSSKTAFRKKTSSSRIISGWCDPMEATVEGVRRTSMIVSDLAGSDNPKSFEFFADMSGDALRREVSGSYCSRNSPTRDSFPGDDCRESPTRDFDSLITRTGELQAGLKRSSVRNGVSTEENDKTPSMRRTDVTARFNELHNSITEKGKTRVMEFVPSWVRALFSEEHVHAALLRRVVEHRWFMFVTVFMILSNSFFMGYTTDRLMQRAIEDYDDRKGGSEGINIHKASSWVDLTEKAFVWVFTCELLLRILALRCSFFGRDLGWNLFDFFVVAFGWFEILAAGWVLNFSYVRLLRTLRIVRTLRMVRVLRYATVFRHLRLLLVSMLASWIQLFWTGVLVSFIFYIFAIVFLQQVAMYVGDASVTRNHDKNTVADLSIYFRSIPMSILTLFMSTTGGMDWWDVMRLLLEVGPFATGAFLLFVFIMVLGVLNIVTGIFVLDSSAIATLDQDMIVTLAKTKEKEVVEMLRKKFALADTDSNGVVTYDELVAFVADGDLQTTMNAFGVRLDIKDVDAIWEACDVDQDERLAIDEFVIGLVEYNERKKRTDLYTLLAEVKGVTKRVTASEEKLLHACLSLREEFLARLHSVEHMLGTASLRNQWPSRASTCGLDALSMDLRPLLSHAETSPALEGTDVFSSTFAWEERPHFV